MRTYLLPSKDTTIYQKYPTQNFGLDEILEVGKLVKSGESNNSYASAAARGLISFDGIQSGAPYPSNARYFLNLYIANAKDVDRGQMIRVHRLLQDWDEGSGYFYPISNVSYKAATWTKATTAVSWSVAGGFYTSTPSSSVSLTTQPIRDVKLEITNIIAPIINGSNTSPWRGLILKYPTTDEQDNSITSNIKFFSKDTSTIFSPTLEIVWNDQQFVTGSLKPIPSSKVSVIPKNIKETYTQGEKDKIYLVVRDQFPDKRYDSAQRYRNTYYLPSESYFRIRDQVSDVEIYSFDIYSAINCDTSGSYIVLDTTGLPANRYYNLDIKVKTNNLVFFPKFEYTFKVENDD